MGYRSEVYIKVVKSAKYQLLEVMSPDWGHWEGVSHLEDDDYYMVAIGDVKWYEGYESVDKVTDFIKTLSGNGTPAGILCVGEDNQTWSYGDPSDVDLYTYVEIEGCPDEESLDGADAIKDFAKFKHEHPELFI